MAGAVSFPITVEIAFGSDPMAASPTWTDVSTRVLRSRTISCSRGTGESGEVDPGRGQIVLTNDDGALTPGETGAYGLVRNRLPIRIRRGTVTVWTGLIEKLAMGFDSGVRPIVTGTLVDRWSRLKARTLTGERIPQVCQALGCADLWPLDDPAGSTRGVSLTSQWAMRSLFGGLPGWGEATPDPHVNAAGMLPVLHMPTGGAWVRSVWDGPGEVTPGVYSAVTVSMWARCPASGSSATWIIDEDSDPGIEVTVSQSLVQVEADPLSITPGSVSTATSSGWRHVALTADFSGAAPVLTLWLDGVQVWTRTTPPSGWVPSRLHTLSGIDADFAYAATWDRVLTSEEIQAIAAAGLDALGQTGQTADVRAALAAALWAPTTVTSQGTFTATMSKQAIDGVSQADLLQQCATTEGGTLLIGTDGWPVLQSRGYRSAAGAVTIPAQVLASDAQWELDDTMVVNVATVDRMALGEVASTVTRRNDASVATYTEVAVSRQLWLDSDVQAVDRANTAMLMWAEASTRSRTFAVDIATCQAVLSESTILGVDIGTRLVVTGLPSQAPTQTAAGWYVEAIADEITATSWKRTFSVTPAIDFLVLDDATFGALDEWPLG